MAVTVCEYHDDRALHERYAIDAVPMLLVADDDEAVRLSLERALTREGTLVEGGGIYFATDALETARDRIVGWFQDRMEFGPRALGARSIIGDARSPNTGSINQNLPRSLSRCDECPSRTTWLACGSSVSSVPRVVIPTTR